MARALTGLAGSGWNNMPAKKNKVSGAGPRKRPEAKARELGSSDAPRAFNQAFNRLERPTPVSPKPTKTRPR
jgi:hypothetical protein